MQRTKHTRPEKVDKFLSHLFPTNRDKLYFEIALLRTNMDSDLYNHCVPKCIELVMSTCTYIRKYSSLLKLSIKNDKFTPEQIHKMFKYYQPIIIDMCYTQKTIIERIDFMDKLYIPLYKTNTEGKKEYNFNTYIFINGRKLLENNDCCVSYTLKNYKNKDYVFTENDVKEYHDYLSKVISAMKNIYNDDNTDIIYSFDELLDEYLKTYRFVPKRIVKQIIHKPKTINEAINDSDKNNNIESPTSELTNNQ